MKTGIGCEIRNGQWGSPLKLVADSQTRAWNPSIARLNGRTFVSYNCGPDQCRSSTKVCNIRLAEIDSRFRAISDRKLELGSDSTIRADMRLFAHHSKLWGVFFEGTLHENASGLVVVEFADDLTARERFKPSFGRRRCYEKNWQFFSHEGDLFCVYSIQPHVVLRRVGPNMQQVARTEWLPLLCPPPLGGTPPIEYEGEYLSFFHSWEPWAARGLSSWRFRIHPVLSVMNRLAGWPFPGAGTWPHRIYSVGAYTFERTFPFRVVRYTPEPLLVARTTDARPGRPACVFLSGVCWLGDAVLLSFGYHDQECRLKSYSPQLLSQRLVRT